MATDIVHQGTLHKLGANVKSWTKRWMILKKDNVLYYYKDPAKSPLGSVPLTDHMFLVKEGRERDLNWPKAVGIERTIVIRTSYRIYYMYADSQQEAAKWIEQLQIAADSIPGKKITKRAELKPSDFPVANGKEHRPKTSSVSSNLSTSVDTVESIYDAANQPDSDCSISTDEENGPGHNTAYSVPSGEPAEEDDIYELADNTPCHSQPSRNSSSKSLTSPVPLPPKQGVNKSGNSGNQPIYEDADAVDTKQPEQLVYEEINDQRPAWAASRHVPPSDPPPPPPDDDDDEDTVPLPRPPLPPKDSGVPPPVPHRGSAAKLTNGSGDSPPMVPLKKKAPASSPKAIHADINDDHDYSKLNKIEKPAPMATSQPVLIQKSRIDSKEVTGTISPTEIDTLNYEPVEDSEEFYVDMATTDEAVNEDQLNVESQRQKELEAQEQKQLEKQRQQKLEAQRQRQEEAKIQRQREAEQNQLANVVIEQYDETKQLNQVELAAQQQAEFESKMRREMEEKKKERSDYLVNKSKGAPAQLTVEGAKDAKKKRSGTNMFKAQRNRLVESVDTEETSNSKPNTGAWLEMERERTMMQEEKLKLEREKRQLEEERQQFELEKRRMKMEMAHLKQ